MESVFGAEHLADIYGTEKDKVNCPFYWKIGACRHGEKCTRLHNKPTISQTVLFKQMYPNPIATPMYDSEGNPISYEAGFLNSHFEDFYEDIFLEFSKYGKVQEINVCDNVAEHLVGNVYVKFYNEDDAATCLKKNKGRFYAGRLLYPEFSPVTDFREARCRQHETSECLRGGLCNFIHLRKLSKEFQKELYGSKYKKYDDIYKEDLRHQKEDKYKEEKYDKYSKRDYREDKYQKEKYSTKDYKKDEYSTKDYNKNDKYDKFNKNEDRYNREKEYRSYSTKDEKYGNKYSTKDYKKEEYSTKDYKKEDYSKNDQFKEGMNSSLDEMNNYYLSEKKKRNREQEYEEYNKSKYKKDYYGDKKKVE